MKTIVTPLWWLAATAVAAASRSQGGWALQVHAQKEGITKKTKVIQLTNAHPRRADEAQRIYRV